MQTPKDHRTKKSTKKSRREAVVGLFIDPMSSHLSLLTKKTMCYNLRGRAGQPPTCLTTTTTYTPFDVKRAALRVKRILKVLSRVKMAPLLIPKADMASDLASV
jgi:hypothetical protein